MTEWDSETAEWYAAMYGEYATNRLAVDELDLPQNGVIVDVGCGTGSALRHAASIASKGCLIGVDPVPRMIEIARERSFGHPASSRIEYRDARRASNNGLRLMTRLDRTEERSRRTRSVPVMQGPPASGEVGLARSSSLPSRDCPFDALTRVEIKHFSNETGGGIG